MESLLSRQMDVYEVTEEEQVGQRSEDLMLMCPSICKTRAGTNYLPSGANKGSVLWRSEHS